MDQRKAEKVMVDDIQKAIMDDTVPKFYSNGFMCAIGQGDVSILFRLGTKDVSVVNLSYTTAKTLAIKLQGLIEYLEKQSDRTIMTTEDITKYLTPQKVKK